MTFSGYFFLQGWQKSVSDFIIKFSYNARSDWPKRGALSEDRARVDDNKLAFLLRNFDKFDPNWTFSVIQTNGNDGNEHYG